MAFFHQLAATLLTLSSPVAAEVAPPPFVPTVFDAELVVDTAVLAETTGKFILPNGAELALSITSDTAVNGQAILRTMLTIDRGTQLQVFGRAGGTAAAPGSGGGGAPLQVSAPGGMAPSGVEVSLDRRSGIQTITPTFSVGSGPNVALGSAPQDSGDLGLTQLPVVPGVGGVTTADGIVTVQTVPNGSQVTLSGSEFSVAHLVGNAIATAIANTANDTTIDTVTHVAIDLRDVTPYQLGSAALRIDALALDATRGMVR